MHKLPLPFTLLTCCGYWRPTTWPIYSIRYWVYNVYSVFMVVLLYTFAIYACIDSFLSNDFKVMIDKFSVDISVICVCVKLTNLFLQRNNIIRMVDVLLQDNCIPKDEQERIIQRECDNYVRNLTIVCEFINELTVFIATVVPFKELIRTGTLPMFDWRPYSESSQALFVICLLHQSCGLMVCANTSVATETMIAGLMLQTGAQFDIFCHRARNLTTTLLENAKNEMSKEDFKNKWHGVVRNMVEYHLQIYKFAYTINTVFRYIIFMQFSVSTTVLCLSVYKLSTLDPLSVDFVWSVCYLSSMLMQVYLYCWFGNEVTLKSKQVGDAIFEMDWTMLPTDVMNDLLIIMSRSMKPVRMTSGQVLVLSAESFMSIIKISYSMYNILQRTSTN